MLNKDNAPTLLGMGAIIVTLSIGTCSTNARIDDGFTNVNRRIDDTNRRIDDVQEDVREVHSMLFELLKNLNPAD